MQRVGGRLEEWPRVFSFASGILYNQKSFDLNQKMFHRSFVPQPLSVLLSCLRLSLTLRIHSFWVIKGEKKKQFIFIHKRYCLSMLCNPKSNMCIVKPCKWPPLILPRKGKVFLGPEVNKRPYWLMWKSKKKGVIMVSPYAECYSLSSLFLSYIILVIEIRLCVLSFNITDMYIA